MSEVSNTPSVFLSDPDVTLWHGDVLETLLAARRLQQQSLFADDAKFLTTKTLQEGVA